MTFTPPTPPGWYPDPSGSGQLRYWDGGAWTEHYSPQPTAAATAPTAPTAPTYGAPAAGYGGGGYAPPPPVYGAPAGYGAPIGYGPPQRQGMSGCLKAFLIVLVLFVVGGTVAGVAVVVVAGRVVHHLAVLTNGTPGRPASLPGDAAGYAGMRTQDHVAGAAGTAAIGSLSATATSWARTTVNNPDGTTPALICGKVIVNRNTVTSKNPIDAAWQLAGDFAWELDTPSGTTVSYDGNNSQAAALSDYLTTNRTGSFAGNVCFADPGGQGQFAITWQPRVFRPERMVWIVKL